VNSQVAQNGRRRESLAADQITIAVTVYDRRRFLSQAIESALNQTVRVQVIVVEDCGPDTALQTWVKERFGSQIQYFRNPRRRGLFDNLNACIELCRTPWLSILHDDDYLDPNFVAAMLDLFQKAPGRSLYFGETILVDTHGKHMKPMFPPLNVGWRPVALESFIHTNLSGFPGQLFRVADARNLSGFRSTSLYCGDWEMWARLTAYCGGAAQIGRPVAYLRHHDDWERGSSKIARSGKLQGLIIVQHKRTLALLKAAGANSRFDRRRFLEEHPTSVKFIIRYAMFFPTRLLAYNCRLLTESTAPHWSYALVQWLARRLGPRLIKLTSRVWNRYARVFAAAN
jgi:glycosyltransferase involved in cell wall biosynthesis